MIIPEEEKSTELHEVGDPMHAAKVSKRISDWRWEAQQMREPYVVGRIVMHLSNEDIHAAAPYLTIGETYALRAIGLIGPEEGFDGLKKSRKKAEKRA